MNRRLVALTLTLAALAAALGPGQGQEPKRPRNLIMQQKLGNAQKLLEGLALKDFELIAKHADELVLLSKRAEWRVLQTPDYTTFSDDFRRNCDTMVKSAKERNLDAAALGYVQMTMNCVNCHKYVREVRIARGESPGRLPVTGD
jgi:hypothetical protein